MTLNSGKGPVPGNVPKGSHGVILRGPRPLDHHLAMLPLFSSQIAVPNDAVGIGPAVVRTVMPPIVITQDPPLFLGGQGPKVPEIIEKHSRGPMPVPFAAGQRVLGGTAVHHDSRGR